MNSGEPARARPTPNRPRPGRAASRGLLGLFCLLSFAGCHAPRPRLPPLQAAGGPAAPAPAPAQLVQGEVELVNASQRYVILRIKGLPSAAGEALVLRGTNEVARLLITGPARPPRFSANLLSGEPRRGDQVRLIGAVRAAGRKSAAP